MTTTEKNTILIASPVRQNAQVLAAFLNSLQKLDTDPLTTQIEYLFMDDNLDPVSSQLLKNFPENRIIIETADKSTSTYVPFSHEWKNNALDQVTCMKNKILQLAQEMKVDYLFLVDSDIVMHPKTLQRLLDADKNIVSNIFWTKWSAGSSEQPQVWLSDKYIQYHQTRNEPVPDAVRKSRQAEFYRKLRIPGTYEVGGLGACTLISHRVLQRPEVNFTYLDNVSFWGEDRHFCIRAKALGFDLWVDTHYPSFHIYRPSELERLPAYLRPCTIAVGMLVKNESKKYLHRTLENVCQFATHLVVIDDHSTDNSIDVVRETLRRYPAVELTLVTDAPYTFSQEDRLRQHMWQLLCALQPTWLVVQDADEIFEKPTQIRDLLETMSGTVDTVAVRMFDMWSDTHYRSDGYWSMHTRQIPMWLRFKPQLARLSYKTTPLHCGRYPLGATPAATQLLSNVRCQHFGWAREDIRRFKHGRYLEADPEGKHGWMAQYHSILDTAPPLAEFTSHPDQYEQFDNRFIVVSDDKVKTVAGVTLNPTWWSRFYEYAWCQQFCRADAVVLDAACGIEHPFKWFIRDMCKEVHVLDFDPDILSLENIAKRSKLAFGEDVGPIINKSPEKIHFHLGSLMKLPFQQPLFDLIFCISVLEENSNVNMIAIFREFGRVLNPKGRLVITFDYPLKNPLQMIHAAQKAGLEPRGSINTSVPADALHGVGGWGEGLKVYRCVFQKALALPVEV